MSTLHVIYFLRFCFVFVLSKCVSLPFASVCWPSFGAKSATIARKKAKEEIVQDCCQKVEMEGL